LICHGSKVCICVHIGKGVYICIYMHIVVGIFIYIYVYIYIHLYITKRMCVVVKESEAGEVEGRILIVRKVCLVARIECLYR